MIIALTGTPGTGKTSVSEILRNRYANQYCIIDINKLILHEKLYTGRDEARDSYEVDTDKLEGRMKLEINQMSNKLDIILESHLSHFLAVDMVIVLRAYPGVLRLRLEKGKNYSVQKAKENADAEALDVILVEAVEHHEKVFEIDTTYMSPQAVAESVVSIIHATKVGNVPEKYLPGKINWIDQVEID